MVKHLYKDFLSNIEKYKASEDFWRDLCESILIKKYGCEHGWKVWLNVVFLDGNSIYSLISPNNRKGIDINQDKPTEEKINIAAWMDKFSPIYLIQDYVEEIVISCELSEESAQIVRELIEIWIEGTTSYEEMEKVIEEKINKL